MAAKIFALRMKVVMDKLVGEAQTVFLKDRNILDGVVILNEVVEDAKKRKEERIILKVDFAKAYDSVEWDYLFDMMRLMNFPPKWVGWIMECVTIASVNVFVNGSPSGEFKLERGIRQGDPLSPFLFLVATEGLNLLTKRAVERGLLKACKVGRERVEVSHIQYADDWLFMVEGNRENVEALRWLLINFEAVSGLSVNFDKSTAFGVNIEREKLEEMVEGWGCRVEKLPIPYLGIKVGERLGGVEGWKEVVEKVRRKLRRWDTRKLSMGGRITIVNSILSAMPLYNMSFLPMPKMVAKQIQSLQCNFLWGGNGESKKMAWIKWDDLCKNKKEGGLGIKNLQAFNKALLCKWIWRYLKKDNKLWKRVLSSRHGVPLWKSRGVREVGGGGGRTGWWKRVSGLVEGGEGVWFWGKAEQRLGDGGVAGFWDGAWAGGKTLKISFLGCFS